jgi:hypothetical protein
LNLFIDIVILPKPSVAEASKSPASIKTKEARSDKYENTASTTEIFMTNSKIQTNNNNPLLVVQPPYQPIPQYGQFPLYGFSTTDSVQQWKPRMDNSRRISVPDLITSDGEQIDNLELVNVSSVIPASSVLFQNVTIESDELDLHTGRIGEQMVYKYLLNEYHQTNSVSIRWENQNGETQLPYDILLIKNGKKYYIEVKSTRTNNHHIFPLSINQIENFLQHRENYFIYRVYTDEKKLIILDNIRWRLIQKQQLTCLLRIIPVSTDQTLSTDE